MNSVKQILHAVGVNSVDSMSLGESYTTEGGPGVMDLTIEKVGDDKLSVGHYHSQHGDLMRDPEVVFDTTKDNWVPIEYRQDPQFHRQNSAGLELEGFLETWDTNIQKQGHVEAAHNMS